MRYLITALLTIILVAPFAWSRITSLPSPGYSLPSSGGGGGGLGLEWVISGATTWRAAGGCLGRTGAAYGSCTVGTATGVNLLAWSPYSGTPVVSELICSHNTDMTLTSTWTLRLAYRGGPSDTASAFMAGILVFDPTTVIGESQVLVINDVPALADGFFTVVISALTQDAADLALAQNISCVVN